MRNHVTRRVLMIGGIAAVLTSTIAHLQAKSIADSTAFQGRLLDASDQPVTGNYDITFSLWTDSTGGTTVWSHTQSVAVAKGLFSTCLGCDNPASFFDVFGDTDLFLQTQLGGQPPMVPRTRLRNSPQAMMAARVRGDIATDPGFVLVGDSVAGGSVKVKAGLESAGGALAQGASLRITGDPDFDLLRLSAGPDSAKIRISGQITGDPDFDLLRIQGGVGPISRGASLTITGDPDFDLLRVSADADSAKIRIGGQITGDPDFDLLRIVGGSGASHISMKSSPSGAPGNAYSWRDEDCDGVSARSIEGYRNGSCVTSTRGMADSDSVQTLHTVDADGDGAPEVSAKITVGKQTQGASFGERIDSNSDGIPEVSLEQTADTSGAGFTAHTIDATPARISTNISVSKQTQGASFGSRCDVGNDGTNESEQDVRCTPDSAIVRAEVTDGSSHAISTMRTRINDLETRLKNIGLLRTTVVSQDCDDLGAGTSVSIDTDNNAVFNGTVWQKVDNSDSRSAVVRDLDQDGLDDVAVSSTASSSRAELKTTFHNGSIPHQDDFHVTLDSTGGTISLDITEMASWTSSARTVCTPDSASHEISVLDPSGYGMKVKEKGNRTKCSANLRVVSPSNTTGRDDDCDGVSSRTVWSQSGGGSLNTLTIEAGSAIDPIMHSSGAHLTQGGVWTNASDENLKENFQSVDGEEILEKVESLPISEWNYRTESDDEKHIGPTAQDFRQVFGLGSDGQTISTIDPSGIALAAIKQLSKQNKSLKEQNVLLQQKLDELSAKVEKLMAK